MHHVSATGKLTATIVLAVGLLGCSPPPLEAKRLDLLVGDAVSITSKADKPVLVRSAVANGNNGNSNCDKAVGKQLAPGESTSLFFMGCGDVMELTVNTDRGSATFSFKK